MRPVSRMCVRVYVFAAPHSFAFALATSFHFHGHGHGHSRAIRGQVPKIKMLAGEHRV